MLKVGIIGFGGIAQAQHLKPHISLEEKGITKLVAVCDICADRFEETKEINLGKTNAKLGDDVKKYTNWKEMLENEDLDMVDICVPTYLHADIAIGALESGHHVLSEKPMSLNYEDCQRMCEAAKKSHKKLMIGQCCRFSTYYLYIKKLIDEKTYGNVISASFQRLSHPPIWGWNNWFLDIEKSGGCILDLHIHDIDLARFMFGNPEKVSCTTKDVYSGRDIVHSRLMYKDFSVLAIGDWSREGMPFEASCTISFEKATLIFAGGIIKVFPRGGEAYEKQWDSISMCHAEIEYFVDSLVNNKDVSQNSPEDSALSVKLVETLVKSADNNGEFVPFVI